MNIFKFNYFAVMLCVLALSACATKPILEKDDQIIALLGTWEGDLKQTKLPAFPSRMVFKENNATLVGKTTYRTLGCSGEMTPIARGDHTFEFYHVITQGKGKCTNGKIELILVDDNTLKTTWIHEDGIASAT